MAQGTRAGAFVAVLFKGTRVCPGGPRGTGEPGRDLGGGGCGTHTPRWPVRSRGTGNRVARLAGNGWLVGVLGSNCLSRTHWYKPVSQRKDIQQLQLESILDF